MGKIYLQRRPAEIPGTCEGCFFQKDGCLTGDVQDAVDFGETGCLCSVLKQVIPTRLIKDAK